MTGHVGRGSIRVRGHNADDATPGRIETSRNHTQNDILAREDTRNLWRLGNDGMRGMRRSLHDTHRRRAPLLHQLRDLFHRRLRADGGGLRARIHDGGQVRQGRLLTEGFDVGKHRRRLRVRAQPRAKLGLHARERGVQLLRRGGAALDFVESFMEDLRDVKQTDNVALFIADRLMGMQV